MRHFRIKEVIYNDDTVEFVIQYTVRFLFITFWKIYNKLPYKTYDDALSETKKILNLQEYSKMSSDKTINYHYIDAFNLDVDVNTNKPKNVSTVVQKPTITPSAPNKPRFNTSTFVPNIK